MARRQSNLEFILEESFTIFSGLTEAFWQVGAVVSALLAFGAYKIWAYGSRIGDEAPAGHFTMQVAGHFSWVYYSAAVMVAVVAWFFAAKAIDTYQNQHPRGR